VQYKTDLTSAAWMDLEQEVTATDTTASLVDQPGTDLMRYYRVMLLQ